MTKGINIKIVGVEDVQQALKKYGVKADSQKKTVMLGAAEIIRQAIADKAPQRTGALSENIGIEESPDNGLNTPFVIDIGPNRRPYFYAHFIEFGTGKHIVQRRTRMLKTGADSYAASMKHPGIQPRPFIRPAFDDNIDRAVKTAIASFKRGTGL